VIYVLTHPTKKSDGFPTQNEKIIITKIPNILSRDTNIIIGNNGTTCDIDGKIFAQVITFSSNLEGTEEEAQSIAGHFKDYMFKKFDNTDMFAAYVIYLMGS
jgi:hypothetical protein